MARTKNTKPKTGTQPAKRKDTGEGKKRFHITDNQKWAAGLVLFFFALYTLWLCASYFFTWHTDQTLPGAGIVTEDLSAEFRSASEGIPPSGEKGSLGARFADLLVGRGFGLFAIAIPLIFIIVHGRSLRYAAGNHRRED